MWTALTDGIRALAGADPIDMAGALGLYVISLVFVGARWRVFIRALGGDVSLWRATLANVGGIAAGNIAPARLGGEACRVALVRQAGSVTWRQATLAAAWDRIAELPPIAVLAAISVVVLGRLIPASRSWAVAVGAAVAAIAVGIGISALKRSRDRLRWWVDFLAADRVSRSTYARGVALASSMWVLDLLRLACATRAVGIALPIDQLAALSMVAMLGGLVPGVAGLGPVEAALVTALLTFGVSPAAAVAATAVERAVSYGFSTMAGVLVITALSGRSLWSAVRRTPVSLPDTADF
ncbi:MAG TPA: lysylphosphatidylglycerol synthase transmembrane domain-containing protein [Vicinamibacterales bacterium]